MMTNGLKITLWLLVPVAVVLLLFGIGNLLKGKRAFTAQERQIISSTDSLMPVYTLPADTAVLRAVSVDFSDRELASPLLETLLSKMTYTVRHPSQDGVGIAAPQVGLNRRAVVVQRFDKANEPFEAYLNIRIDRMEGELVCGPEGCLSVPGMRGMVPRYPQIQISYVQPGSTERQTEWVEGFTAVIFQHECDHLDGILYIDKAVELSEVEE